MSLYLPKPILFNYTLLDLMNELPEPAKVLFDPSCCITGKGLIVNYKGPITALGKQEFLACLVESKGKYSIRNVSSGTGESPETIVVSKTAQLSFKEEVWIKSILKVILSFGKCGLDTLKGR